ncbi:hypothetical protein OAO87_01980 [bacterium]|nr:hypothetical protein [bacterium]
MPLPEPTSMPILALSLANLRLGDLIDSIDAPTASATKRKAPCTGHHGLANDSSLAVRLVALSRLMRARNDEILHPAAQSPVGIAGRLPVQWHMQSQAMCGAASLEPPRWSRTVPTGARRALGAL